MKYFINALVLAIVLVSCKKEDVAVIDNREKTELNVSYGPDAKQKMDIYLPAGRTTASKAIVLIHGGAWSGGDKSDLTPFIDTLKKRLPDYAIFNISYRLAAGGANLFPAQEQDVKGALTYIYNKRNEYYISDKFVLLGVSAGAHLSLLQAYKYTSPVRVKAVVDFYGPTDMVEMYNNPASVFAPPSLIQGVVGATPTSNPTLYQQSSPVNFVNVDCPPTIIFHGGADVIVSVNQSTALRNKLQIAGVPREFVLYPTENHGWVGANLVDSFNRIVSFLRTHVN